MSDTSVLIPPKSLKHRHQSRAETEKSDVTSEKIDNFDIKDDFTDLDMIHSKSQLPALDNFSTKISIKFPSAFLMKSNPDVPAMSTHLEDSKTVKEESSLNSHHVVTPKIDSQKLNQYKTENIQIKSEIIKGKQPQTLLKKDYIKAEIPKTESLKIQLKKPSIAIKEEYIPASQSPKRQKSISEVLIQAQSTKITSSFNPELPQLKSKTNELSTLDTSIKKITSPPKVAQNNSNVPIKSSGMITEPNHIKNINFDMVITPKIEHIELTSNPLQIDKSGNLGSISNDSLIIKINYKNSIQADEEFRRKQVILLCLKLKFMFSS